MTAFRDMTPLLAARLLSFGVRRTEARELEMDRCFAFYRSDVVMVSPLVSVASRGTVVNLLNQLPKSPNSIMFGSGNMPQGWCADFVAGCCELPKVVRDVQLWNWWPQEEFDACGLAEGTPEYEVAFVSWLDRQAKTAGFDDSPVFISTCLPFVAYQGGAELCRVVVDGSGPDRRAVWVAAPRGRNAKKKKTAERGAAPDRPRE